MPAAKDRPRKPSPPARSSEPGRPFGDFQTPDQLAVEVCRVLVERGVAPKLIVEPTCGLGSFVKAALDAFPTARCEGLEINARYVAALRRSLRKQQLEERARIRRRSFFDVDWQTQLAALPQPILVLGNPPWVTNAELGALGSDNLPAKANSQGLRGLDALTGKSNFDISEWMLQRLMEACTTKRGWLAMLCKTAVARKALDHAWRQGIEISQASLYRIDAAAHFGAAVDACLLLAEFAEEEASHEQQCDVYASLAARSPERAFGARDGRLIADLAAYDRRRHLVWHAESSPPRSHVWRSGVKHDCARVMELRRDGKCYTNGLGERIELEDEYVFPMLKSSDLAKGSSSVPKLLAEPVRWMLVPQRSVAGDTAEIQHRAPKTWRYLQRHAELLARRASSIYRNRPPFSVFGVGDYTFAPWKVGISGFYKRLAFTAIGSVAGRPIVLDDTASFIPCQSEVEARHWAELLNSPTARDFFSAWLFWDAKRPITIELLRKLDMMALSRELAS